MIAHVGSISTDVSIELAKHAKSKGVDAISSVPPFYYNFSEREIIKHYTDIVNETKMPFILYNFPAYSGFVMTPEFVTNLRNKNINFIGLKHTSMNLYSMQQLLSMENFIVLSGHDEVFLGAKALGAHGAIGSTYNFMAQIFIKMSNLLEKNKLIEARNLQDDANKFINLIKGDSVISLVKYAVKLSMDIECNGCRRPIIDINNEKKALVEKTLSENGLM